MTPSPEGHRGRTLSLWERILGVIAAVLTLATAGLGVWGVRTNEQRDDLQGAAQSLNRQLDGLKQENDALRSEVEGITRDRDMWRTRATSTATPSPGPSPSLDDGGAAQTYLSSLRNLTGNYVNSPKNLSIGKTNYPNSLELACINYEGGGKARYDVAQYRELKGVIGLPSNVADLDGATCVVSFTDQAGKALGSTYRLSAGSGPKSFSFSLENVSQVSIRAILEYPSSKGTKHIYVALGDPILT